MAYLIKLPHTTEKRDTTAEELHIERWIQNFEQNWALVLAKVAPHEDVFKVLFAKNKPPEPKVATGERVQRDVDIFRKIASECHPDKTDDPDKHEKFVAAKEAYHRGDSDALTHIFTGYSRLNTLKSKQRQVMESLAYKLIRELGVEKAAEQLIISTKLSLKNKEVQTLQNSMVELQREATEKGLNPNLILEIQDDNSSI